MTVHAAVSGKPTGVVTIVSAKDSDTGKYPPTVREDLSRIIPFIRFIVSSCYVSQVSRTRQKSPSLVFAFQIPLPSVKCLAVMFWISPTSLNHFSGTYVAACFNEKAYKSFTKNVLIASKYQ